LGFESSQRLFAEHGVQPADIDFILLCTQSPDYFLPTTACLLQERLGIPRTAGALDFNLGCSGYVYGLGLAAGLIETGQARNVLLITAETYSKFISPRDKSVRSIFGDAAASTLVAASETGSVGPFVYGTDGSGGKHLIVKTGGMRQRQPVAQASEVVDEYGNVRDDNCLFMNGSEIFGFTLKAVPQVVEGLRQRSGLGDDLVDYYVFHQANKYMLDTLRKKLKIAPEKFCECYAGCGNTVSSTIPIGLYHAIKNGRVLAGNRVMLVGFGVGLSWAGCMIQL
jgi:3-oxoacyl-[acyl-carrier-protein] synthase-3